MQYTQAGHCCELAASFSATPLLAMSAEVLVAASGLVTPTMPDSESEQDRSIGELGVSAATDDDDDRLLLIDLSWSDADDADDAAASRLQADAVVAITAACTAAVVAAAAVTSP